MVKSLRYRHRWLNYMDPLYWLSNFRKRDQLFKYLSSLHKNDWASPWKVCVVPHSFKQLQRNPKGRKFLDPKSTTDTSSSSFDRGYIVYIYDDYEGKFKKKLNLSLPAWVVGKTLKLLLDRKKKEIESLAFPNPSKNCKVGETDQFFIAFSIDGL